MGEHNHIGNLLNQKINKFYVLSLFCLLNFLNPHLRIYLLTSGKDREREKERSVVALIFHSLVDSCICPDEGSNLQPWIIETKLHPNELQGQGYILYFMYFS